MIRSFDLHLNSHFIDNYSVGVFFATGTFRLVGTPSWACETGGYVWNQKQNSVGVHQHNQEFKCFLWSTPLELGCLVFYFPPVPQAPLGVIQRVHLRCNLSLHICFNCQFISGFTSNWKFGIKADSHFIFFCYQSPL